MITENELRIGNWINFPFCGIQQVTAADLSDWDACGATLGIHLTPEILEKAGFENISQKDGFGLFVLGMENIPGVHVEGKMNVIYIKKSVVIYFGLTEIGTGFIYGSNHLCAAAPTNYLHQLQNLYFALTGEELKIEL